MCFVVIIQDAQTHERIYQMRKGLKKSAVAVLLVFLLLGSAVPAFAQDLPEPFCGQLSEDDCGVLTSSQEAMQEVGSGVYNSEINFLLCITSYLFRILEPSTGKIPFLVRKSFVYEVFSHVADHVGTYIVNVVYSVNFDESMTPNYS